MFTKEQINEILAVCHKATPGPWYTEKTGANFRGFSTECIIATVGGNSKVYANPSEGHIFPAADKDFIALARTALPELAQRVIELEADNVKLRAIAEVAQGLRRAWEDEVDRDTEAEFAGELIQALADAGYGR